MTKQLISLAVVSAMVSCFNSSGYAQQVFYDSFDTDTSSQWNVNATADATANWMFDYSALGIPSAPNSVGGTTLGVRFAANTAAGAQNAVSISPIGQNFSGLYTLQFDMWINVNGPFPGGGAGSTEFFTSGVGVSGTGVEWTGASSGGGWFAVDGEGGSSRDYRAYKGTAEQFAESGQFAAGTSSAGGGAHNNSDSYYTTAFNGQDAPSLQQSAYAQQAGTVSDGALAFAWHQVTLTANGDSLNWNIDGLDIATLDATIAPFSLDGNIFVGYMDVFTSVSDNPNLSFGLVDNVRVTLVPEPSSLALAALGGFALLLLRRRK